ncbi:hypothetical protein RLEG12_16505 [Rhizobium leguminosarum bv. trifolii CB782]|nr:hypothetical protein RLEG12_16505 [Rhizobium leguminosarum bv. trifolii CB782]
MKGEDLKRKRGKGRMMAAKAGIAFWQDRAE